VICSHESRLQGLGIVGVRFGRDLYYRLNVFPIDVPSRGNDGKTFRAARWYEYFIPSLCEESRKRASAGMNGKESDCFSLSMAGNIPSRELHKRHRGSSPRVSTRLEWRLLLDNISMKSTGVFDGTPPCRRAGKNKVPGPAQQGRHRTSLYVALPSHTDPAVAPVSSLIGSHLFSVCIFGP